MVGRLDSGSVGDHFLIGLRPCPYLHEKDQALLGDIRPAGIILYKSNFVQDRPYEDWLVAYSKLIADVRRVIGRDRIFIAIDHEGGRVCRTPVPITRFAYAAQWALRAAAVGTAMGTELASLAINLNFAPVLDIHSNPNNPVIGERAFGTTSEVVSSSAVAFMSAMQAQGVLACGKHFPGHGDTDRDSHYELPVLNCDLGALSGRELKPFVAAIAAGIPMIMTAHVLVPRVDPQTPVTLSRRFNTELLREQLGFNGVVVSDDVGMGAVAKWFEDSTAAVRLLQAGSDMIMVCAHWTNTERCRGYAQAIIDAERNGTISTVESRSRIQTLLARTPQHSVSPLPPATLQANKKVAALFEAETVEVI